jgi:hypothetical protein
MIRNTTIQRLLILVSFLLSSCTVVIPDSSQPIPTPSDAERARAESATTSRPYLTTLSEFASELALWKTLLIEEPLMVPFFIDYPIMHQVNTLLLPLTREEFASIAGPEEAESKIQNIAQEVELVYGTTARSIFEITHFDSITGYYLKLARETDSVQERERYLDTVIQYIQATIGSLYRVDPSSPYANYGALVAASLRQSDDLELSRDQLAWWRFNILTVLTANDEDLPLIPTSTPRPTPTLGPTSTPRGPYDSGSTIARSMGCIGCHYFDKSYGEQPTFVGPHLGNIHETAAIRVEGQDAKTYIYNSIVDPNAFIVEGYVFGVMPSYGNILTQEEIDLLVEWLLDPNRN